MGYLLFSYDTVEIRIITNATCRWHVAATSANTGGFIYSRQSRECKRISSGSPLEEPQTNLLLRYPAEAAPVTAGLLLADRCHSLRSLLPPLAALPSLPSGSPLEELQTNLLLDFRICR